MSAVYFVDTNVLVYGRDASEPQKQPRAWAWLDRLWHDRTGRTSCQVLSEYFVTVTRKLDPGLSPEEAWQDVEDLRAWRPVGVDMAVLETAWSAHRSAALSWWDALIVGAAKSCGAEVLLSEDLQDGRDFGGLVVVNPLVHTPEGGRWSDGAP